MKLHPLAVEKAKSFRKSKTELIEILGKMDKSKEYLEHDVNSLFSYAEKILKLSAYDICQMTQVIRKSQSVPELKEAVMKGVISIEKASRIAPVISKEKAKDWIELAAQSTHREIEKAVKTEKPEALLREKITPKTATKSELRVNISADIEKKLKRAQEVFKANTLEETLEKVLDVSLKIKDPMEKAKRAKAHSTCNINSTTTQSAINLNTTRYIPATLKHKVYLRDRGTCQIVGCKSKHWVEIHHKIPLSMGGKHEINNLITLCSIHHSQKHGFVKTRWKQLNLRV